MASSLEPSDGIRSYLGLDFSPSETSVRLLTLLTEE